MVDTNEERINTRDMRKRIVLWGSKEKDEKILVGVRLRADDNKIDIYTFSVEEATEEFFNKMMNLWRSGTDIPFPDGHVHIERELSVSEDLLPENIKVDRTDIILRAKSEWHFVVLSSKMYQMFASELDDFKQKVENLTDFDKGLWEEMKGYWNKVQGQVREKNLFREHGENLKKQTNGLFEEMKKLRKSFEDDFKKVSKEKLDEFASKIDNVQERMGKGMGLHPLFEELKKIQSEFKDTRFTREDRNKLWNRLDKTFKDLKEKRYGKKGGENSPMERLDRRYKGLISAIGKMESSISRDKGDHAYEIKKIDQTDGQLEAQIRQAKLKMIEERINSKEEKLADMVKTRGELDVRIEKEKKLEAKKAEKNEIEKQKEIVKDKIATEIKEKAEDLEADAGKLEKAAAEIKESKSKKAPKDEKSDSLLTAIGATMGETIEDVVDTVKAVAEVLSEKVEETIKDIVGEEE